MNLKYIFFCSAIFIILLGTSFSYWRANHSDQLVILRHDLPAYHQLEIDDFISNKDNNKYQDILGKYTLMPISKNESLKNKLIGPKIKKDFNKRKILGFKATPEMIFLGQLTKGETITLASVYQNSKNIKDKNIDIFEDLIILDIKSISDNELKNNQDSIKPYVIVLSIPELAVPGFLKSLSRNNLYILK
jgi:hypothetical protein